MKIIAFGASNSRNSINGALAKGAAERLKSRHLAEADIEVLDLNEFEMPIYSTDRQKETGIPAEAHAFFDRLGTADALLISYAEHNGNFTAAFKNIFDWASRIDMRVFQDKPGVAMATSPGQGGASNVLSIAKSAAPFFGFDLAGTFSLPRFHDGFDHATGLPSDEAKLAELDAALDALAAKLTGQ